MYTNTPRNSDKPNRRSLLSNRLRNLDAQIKHCLQNWWVRKLEALALCHRQAITLESRAGGEIIRLNKTSCMAKKIPPGSREKGAGYRRRVCATSQLRQTQARASPAQQAMLLSWRLSNRSDATVRQGRSRLTDSTDRAKYPHTVGIPDDGRATAQSCLDIFEFYDRSLKSISTTVCACLALTENIRNRTCWACRRRPIRQTRGER